MAIFKSISTFCNFMVYIYFLKVTCKPTVCLLALCVGVKGWLIHLHLLLLIYLTFLLFIFTNINTDTFNLYFFPVFLPSSGIFYIAFFPSTTDLNVTLFLLLMGILQVTCIFNLRQKLISTNLLFNIRLTYRALTPIAQFLCNTILLPRNKFYLVVY